MPQKRLYATLCYITCVERSNNPYEYANYRSITMNLINALDTGIPAALRFDHNTARAMGVLESVN